MSNPKNNSRNLIAASKDPELRERLIVLAAEMGISNAEAWVNNNILDIVAADVDAAKNTVAYNYGYAQEVREDKVSKAKKAYDDAVAEVKPGKNPGAVNDDHIRFALNKVKASQTTITQA